MEKLKLKAMLFMVCEKHQLSWPVRQVGFDFQCPRCAEEQKVKVVAR